MKDKGVCTTFHGLTAGLFLLAGLVFATGLLVPRPALAFCCVCFDCDPAEEIIEEFHEEQEEEIIEHISEEFNDHREWLAETFFEDNLLPAMMRFTAQMSAVAMHQVMSIGMFLDAKQQLETQRLFQELQAQAHKDYQPSEDFCWFGTNVRSLAGSEQRGHINAMALNQRSLDRQLSNRGTVGAESSDDDKRSRWMNFAENYCDPRDNNWEEGKPNSGLRLACLGSIADKGKRVNIDIDYTRLLEEPRTLDVNFADTGPTNAETDVIALGNNLYGHNPLPRSINPTQLGFSEHSHLYLALRSIAAKRSVAENSYNAIVGLKSAGSSAEADGEAPRTHEFLAAVMVELGMPEGEIFDIIGENPSYYAQLEILAKRIYQNPDFYANLYDKPANVARKGVALQAIELMLDRAIYESQLRQEMAMSVLLSSKLRGSFREINAKLPGVAGGR